MHLIALAGHPALAMLLAHDEAKRHDKIAADLFASEQARIDGEIATAEEPRPWLWLTTIT